MTPASPADPLTAHAPFGADADFAFGPGSRARIRNGSFSTECDFWIGCRHSPQSPWSLLPFYRPDANRPEPLGKGRYGRFLGWAGDKWMIGPLVFKLCTPFDPAPATEEDERFLHAPVLCGYIEYDNTHSDDPVELVVGLSGEFAPLALDGAIGFHHSAGFAFAAATADCVRLHPDLAIIGNAAGRAGLIHVSVSPRTKEIRSLVVGFHHPAYHYTRFFPTLSDVVRHGLDEHPRYLALSDKRDAEFLRCPLAPASRSSAAHEIRQWLAGTARISGDAPIDLSPMRAMHSTVLDPARG